MAVKFTLDIEKVIASSIYIAQRDIPELTIGKMMKLIFLADKCHLVRYGRPITGDRYEAMKDGPVPSFAYNIFKELLRKPRAEQCKRLADALEIDRRYELPRFKARKDFDREQLSMSDTKALDVAIELFGNKTFNELRAITHAMVAYDNAWNARPKSRQASPMKYEDFFEDDASAIAGAREEMIEDYHLRTSFAKP